MKHERRNMARSVINTLRTPFAKWSDWTVFNAVKNGYKVSGWVYKAVSLISKNLSTVPWIVVDKDGEVVDGHPLALLLQNPNPFFSRQDFFELIAAWQQLSGMAYVKQIFVDGVTKELWPISPDRIFPVASKEMDKLIDSYEIIDTNGVRKVSPEFTVDNIIPFKFLDPSDPIIGIGPLQVAAKAVDIDTDQLNWNKSAMQNRGVLDGVFTFAEALQEGVFDVYKQKIKELFSGKREIGIIGSNAKYQQLSLSPVEMDFLNSRKFNREEIFIIFGVPPQLAGVQEATTYNNFNTARVVFWETTLIPILEDMKNTLNKALASQLSDGLSITYNLKDVPALRKDLKEKAEVAKIYSDMGVPIKQLNEMFTLGVPEYDGWDKSIKSQQIQTPLQNRGVSDLMLKKLDKRNVQDLINLKDKKATTASKMFKKALDEQRVAVFKALDESSDTSGALAANSAAMEAALTTFYKKTAITFAGSVIVDKRGLDINFDTRAIDPIVDANIDAFLQAERVILTELSLINKSTIALILDAVVDGEAEGKSITDVQQAILDGGTFSPERALRIARTVAGTAQSIGQLSGAIAAGATKKIWRDADFEVREEHQQRDGEIVGINDRFSTKFVNSSPRFPLDQDASASDRINCRCSMTFSV